MVLLSRPSIALYALPGRWCAWYIALKRATDSQQLILSTCKVAEDRCEQYVLRPTMPSEKFLGEVGAVDLENGKRNVS